MSNELYAIERRTRRGKEDPWMDWELMDGHDPDVGGMAWHVSKRPGVLEDHLRGNMFGHRDTAQRQYRVWPYIRALEKEDTS